MRDLCEQFARNERRWRRGVVAAPRVSVGRSSGRLRVRADGGPFLPHAARVTQYQLNRVGPFLGHERRERSLEEAAVDRLIRAGMAKSFDERHPRFPRCAGCDGRCTSCTPRP